MRKFGDQFYKLIRAQLLTELCLVVAAIVFLSGLNLVADPMALSVSGFMLLGCSLVTLMGFSFVGSLTRVGNSLTFIGSQG